MLHLLQNTTYITSTLIFIIPVWICMKVTHLACITGLKTHIITHSSVYNSPGFTEFCIIYLFLSSIILDFLTVSLCDHSLFLERLYLKTNSLSQGQSCLLYLEAFKCETTTSLRIYFKTDHEQTERGLTVLRITSIYKRKIDFKSDQQKGIWHPCEPEWNSIHICLAVN